MERTTRRVLIWVAAALAVCAVLFVSLRGCTLMPWNRRTGGGGTVSVKVTRDFGRAKVRSASVPFRNGMSVMDALSSTADVQTDYGGGFVTSIQGIGSTSVEGGPADWFYYVNGVLSDLGADQFEVGAGDLVWWDLHSWKEGGYLPAVIGAYPRPFAGGFRDLKDSTLLAGGGMDAVARDAGAYLEGHGARLTYLHGLQGFDPGGAAGPTMVITSGREAAATPWIASLLESPVRGGAFIRLEDDEIVPLDEEGEPAPIEGEVLAAIVSTGEGMGDDSPVWLVVCRGEQGARIATAVLLDGGRLNDMMGAVVDADGTVYGLPR
ncbi:MAG: DUF4430 domain-containing protein [Actinobacteria bacterium]|nr:DUF4430 domain-containing protein [Actinomycetota bacterium]MBU1943570.1 DUF4430 domain-containing protein [Actinomycetota bacterium]MBU2688904.1 DUF4430 domain-containing protein [Actinomycetota bacterium]